MCWRWAGGGEETWFLGDARLDEMREGEWTLEAGTVEAGRSAREAEAVLLG